MTLFLDLDGPLLDVSERYYRVDREIRNRFEHFYGKERQRLELEQTSLENSYDELELLGFPVSIPAFELLQTSFRGEILAENGAEERFVGPQTGALAGYFSLGSPVEYFDELRRPEDRDPRGYILPSDQADFPTATKFVNTLIKNGVTVHRATGDFTVDGVTYPADSWVVMTRK